MSFRYFKTDSRKIIFREYWDMVSFPTVLTAWAFKLLRLPMRLTNGIPEPVPFAESLIEISAVPPEIQAKMNGILDECRALGFQKCWFYTLKNSLIAGKGYGIELLHESGEIIGEIISASYGSRESLVLGFISMSEDGEIFGTTNRRSELKSPPEYNIERRVAANAGQLYQRHRDRLSEGLIRQPCKQFQNLEEVSVFEDKFRRRTFEFHTGRGVWVEMSAAEVESLRRNMQNH